jgi:general secretion pathway protein A
MYEAFYGCQRTPFARTIDSADLYIPPLLEEIAGRLNYAAKRQLFAVFTGEAGTGKTTTLRWFKDQLPQSRYQVFYLSDSKLTPRHFYKGLLEQIGCEAKFYRGDAKRQLHREIELMRGIHHMHPVVIVDEAHLLDRKMLEEVRFLLNFRMDSMSPMTLILAGQSELWDRLKLQSFAAIRQRIDMVCRMSPFDRAQTESYLKKHLSAAGTDRDIFSAAAIDALYAYSGGIARLINKAATHCLLYGAQSQKPIIDDHMVTLVINGEMV